MTIDTNIIYHGDCYSILKKYIPEKSIDLIYLDPPFSFDPKYARLWLDKETIENFEELKKGGVKHYVSWVSKRLEQCNRVLKETGSIYLHCNWRFGHYLKIEMDNIFGYNNFQNEIIWYHRGGGVSKKRFGRKHDTIFFYTKSRKNIHTFNIDNIRQPYSKDSFKRLKYKARAFRGEKVYDAYKPHPLGKHPDDVLLIQPVMPSSKERVGWFSQKPEALLETIIKASSNENDIVLDPMCGCGTTIVVAHKLKRKWIGIDISSQACKIMKERMEKLGISKVEIRGMPLTITDLKKLSPFDFQDYICDMTNARRADKKSADMGIDGFYSKEDSEFPLQIKQQEKVGRTAIDNFETALRRKRKTKGYFIAFSFTKGAYEEAARARDDNLELALVRVDELIKKDYEL